VKPSYFKSWGQTKENPRHKDKTFFGSYTFFSIIKKMIPFVINYNKINGTYTPHWSSLDPIASKENS